MFFCLIFRVHVIVSGILPRGQNEWDQDSRLPTEVLVDVNARACAVNRRLDRHLHQHPCATYLPHPDWTTESKVQRELLSRDGLHLSELGFKTLGEEITDAVASVKQVTTCTN
jgi:lysophospholipase L1-like esterase